MNKVAIIYSSIHHNNTEKLLKSAKGIDIYNINEISNLDFSKYEIIGLASGIYMGKFHKKIENFVSEHLKDLHKIILVYTSGSNNKKYGISYKASLESEGLEVLDIYSCKGYDTYGIFKLVGGKSKNHPNQADMDKFQDFINNLLN